MKNINFNRKYILLFLLLIPTFLAGCMQVSIIGKIDSSFLITYQGEVEINLSKYEHTQQALAQESLLKLSKYWQDIGYESQVNLETEKYHIYFKKQKQCASYEEAFKELFALMTDEYSIFSNLSYVFTSYENYSEYEIHGSIDATNILDMDVYNTLQEDIREIVDSEINNLDAVIGFDIPNHDNQESSTGSAYKYHVIPYKLNNFTYNGKIINSTTSNYGGFNNNASYYHTLNYVLSGILLILIILAIFLVIKQRNSI